MEASIIACDQQIIDGVLILNNLTISVISESPLARLAFFIQTNDSNDTIYRYNFPVEILHNNEFVIDLHEYVIYNIPIHNTRGALKYQIYIRNVHNNQVYISCPLLTGEYSEIRL